LNGRAQIFKSKRNKKLVERTGCEEAAPEFNYNP